MNQDAYTTPSPPNSSMAIASLIASILGVTLIPTIGSIIGVILGYMARKEIRESHGAMGGEGMAKAGIIIGWIGIALAVLGICVGIAFLFLGLSIPGLTICAELGNTY